MLRLCAVLFVVMALLQSQAEARIEDDAKPAAADKDKKDEKQNSSAQPAPATSSSGWKFGGSLRVRPEWWNWFNPGAVTVGRQNDYAFFGGYARLTVEHSLGRADVFAEVSVPFVAGLPTDAIAPAPQGQLGLGPAYRAANGNRNIYAFVRQANVTFRTIGENSSLRLGRFEFVEGQESLTQDATLDWIKRERIAHRLIGNFAFSDVQRTADGAQYSYNDHGTNVTFVAGKPTVGVFELNGNKEVRDVEYVYVGVTHTGAAKDFDARLFYIYYRDDRGLIPTDNRPLSLRSHDTTSLNISTVGGHYTRKLGGADLLLWGAWQTGDWGVLSQRAWAYVAEVGYQPPHFFWKPWLRGGTDRTSGDRNPTDGKHQTFFQILPTPRIYARFPFYNMMNLEDNFAEIMLRPGKRVAIRSDYRWLRLSQANDLWYSGGGAFQGDTFGFSGRPSSGSRDLGNLADFSIDFKATSKTVLTFYYGYASGG
ncbi:MAG TPA: alginate export family protein, partial [Acidobacteriota bacterium]|nr:alginate export family protein [Acidobacteriota bacterium]